MEVISDDDGASCDRGMQNGERRGGIYRVKSDSRNWISHSKMTQSILETIINCTIRGIINNIQVNWDSCVHEGQLSHPKSVGTGEGGEEEMTRRR